MLLLSFQLNLNICCSAVTKTEAVSWMASVGLTDCISSNLFKFYRCAHLHSVNMVPTYTTLVLWCSHLHGTNMMLKSLIMFDVHRRLDELSLEAVCLSIQEARCCANDPIFSSSSFQSALIPRFSLAYLQAASSERFPLPWPGATKWNDDHPQAWRIDI